MGTRKDPLTKAQRSYCMFQVKGKDTSLEQIVRSALHKHGLRFDKHVSDLPGKPDIVFPRHKIAVFLDGDFWHGYRFNRLARVIYKVLGGATYKDLGYMRGDPAEKQIELLVRKLRSLGVDIRHENHQMITSVRKVKVEASGIVLQ